MIGHILTSRQDMSQVVEMQANGQHAAEIVMQAAQHVISCVYCTEMELSLKHAMIGTAGYARGGSLTGGRTLGAANAQGRRTLPRIPTQLNESPQRHWFTAFSESIER